MLTVLNMGNNFYFGIILHVLNYVVTEPQKVNSGHVQ